MSPLLQRALTQPASLGNRFAAPQEKPRRGALGKAGQAACAQKHTSRNELNSTANEKAPTLNSEPQPKSSKGQETRVHAGHNAYNYKRNSPLCTEARRERPVLGSATSDDLRQEASASLMQNLRANTKHNL